MTKIPKAYRFTVRGRGSFPIDMLRYDRATPYNEVDSNSISRAMHVGPWESVDVELISQRPPTEDRWASFSWQVVTVAGEV